MAPNLTSQAAILNLTQLVITIIVCGLISNVGCIVGTSGEWFEFQFISAVVYGFLIINLIVIAVLFTESELDQRVRLLISGLAAILWLCSGSMILHSVDSGICGKGEWYDRAIAGGILSLANVVAYGVEAFFVIMSVLNKT